LLMNPVLNVFGLLFQYYVYLHCKWDIAS